MTDKQTPPKAPQTSNTAQLVIAILLAGLGFGAVLALVIVAAVTGRHVAPWIIPAAWMVGAATGAYLALQWIQRRVYRAVMKLRSAMAAQQLAAIITAAKKKQMADVFGETEEATTL